MLKKHHKPTDCTNYYTANNLSNTQSQNKTLYIHNTLNCIRALGVCWGILWNNPLIDLDFFFPSTVTTLLSNASNTYTNGVSEVFLNV